MTKPERLDITANAIVIGIVSGSIFGLSLGGGFIGMMVRDPSAFRPSRHTSSFCHRRTCERSLIAYSIGPFSSTTTGNTMPNSTS